MELQPFDDRDGVIWSDGALIPWRDCKIHVLSHGLHYASCVFEGERVYDGRIFKLREHSERLVGSGRILGFEIPYSVAEINQACRDLVAAMGIQDGYVRPVAWSGSEMMGVSAQQTKIHLAIATWVWPTYFTMDARMRGLKLRISEWRRPAPDTAPTKSKAAGLYMIATMSKHKAESNGFEDALLLDWRGYIAESTGANFFMVKKGELHTPIPECFLDGITRRTVMDLARQRGIAIHERHIKPEELAGADEVFITGTAAEVTPVSQIDDYKIAVGPICRQLAEDYERLVRSKQAKASAA